jgi:arylsulfatase A-like enzyme
MNRRDVLKSSLLGASALAVTQSFAQPAGESQEAAPHIWPNVPAELNGSRMPNVLWICPDMQRFDTIEGLNNDVIHTPNIRKLMSESVTFTHAYTQSTVCSPSRASFLTGRYPHTTGLRALGQRIRPDERLVTKILSDAGYACGLSGKLHLSPTFGGRLEDRIDDGYSVFDWSHDISALWPGHNMWRVWLDEQGVKWPTPPKGNDAHAWGVPIDGKYMQTAWCSDRAIQFIRGQRQFNPWFMSVNIFQPHAPYWPAEQYLDHYRASDMLSPNYREGELKNKPVYQQVDNRGASGGHDVSFAKTSDLDHRKMKAAYYAMIEQVDTEVGRMLQALEESGQADDTIVIYMSDHGEMLGDHGIFLKGPYFYEGAIRVPLMIRWPGKFKAGLKSDALVEMVDLAPTLLECTGMPIPVGMQGKSLFSLLTGKTTRHRDSIYCEYFDSLALYNPPPMSVCVRTEQYKMAFYQNLGLGELYDLDKDPDETNNMWDSSAARATREMMMQTMVTRMIDTVDPLPERKCMW